MPSIQTCPMAYFTGVQTKFGVAAAASSDDSIASKPLTRDCSVSISVGDVTRYQADGYVVPQPPQGAFRGGVSGSIASAGGLEGIRAYAEAAALYELVTGGEGPPFGHVIMFPWSARDRRQLLHVVSAYSGVEHEFRIVQLAMYNALKHAQQNGLKTIVVPSLGTGISGELTPEQSARAMLAGIYRFAQEGGKMDVRIVIWDSPSEPQKSRAEQEAFTRVLRGDAYERAPANERGAKRG